jgi:hypothetical protein
VSRPFCRAHPRRGQAENLLRQCFERPPLVTRRWQSRQPPSDTVGGERVLPGVGYLAGGKVPIKR